jgi:Nuclease-related domain
MFLYNFSRMVSRVSQPTSPPPSIPPNLLPIVMIMLVVIIVIIGGGLWLFWYLFNSVVNRIENKIGNYRKGQEGEDRVVEAMRQSLDGNWTLFRNVILPSYKGDIDAVLVGPPGVWALEIKTFAGEWKNTGEQWKYRTGSKWRLYKSSPSHQARKNASHLRSFLEAEEIKQWVKNVVVWANRASPLTVDNPSVATWTLDDLPEKLGGIWEGQAIPESDRTRIIEKLTRLCQPPTVEE